MMKNLVQSCKSSLTKSSVIKCSYAIVSISLKLNNNQTYIKFHDTVGYHIWLVSTFLRMYQWLPWRSISHFMVTLFITTLYKKIMEDIGRRSESRISSKHFSSADPFVLIAPLLTIFIFICWGTFLIFGMNMKYWKHVFGHFFGSKQISWHCCKC
jgi:hypothetical protein